MKSKGTTNYELFPFFHFNFHIPYAIIYNLLTTCDIRNTQYEIRTMKKSLAHLPKQKQDESSSLQELEQIPGVGITIARDMQNIGIHSICDLKGNQAEQLYDRLCQFKAAPVDRCMLYVFRCAIYYASNTDHDPELLKWQNFKDKK